ncbi:glycosyltransferase family 1 protein [Patescibacteria group bacterium]|nr:MAG: glycosyltransferase family 1 protein [Patescibacteria group bacterium]
MGGNRSQKMKSFSHNIKVLYHGERNSYKFLRWDAVGQELNFLSRHFGNLIFGYVTPLTRYLFYFALRLPPFLESLYFHRVIALDKKVDLHHVFYPHLHNFRYFRQLKKPIVYSSVARRMGHPSDKKLVATAKKMPHVNFFAVACREDKRTLLREGIQNVEIVLPGINLKKFSKLPFNSKPQKILLMGTSPLNPEKFKNRGINLILDILKKLPDLKVIFLWRGIAYKEMLQLVKKEGLENQVEIINQLVKPEEYLEKSAGAIATFMETKGNKAYPNSIIESLAAGRPVIVSTVMPIAEIVKKNNCGVVVKPDPESLFKGVQEYFQNYQKLAKNCCKTATLFSEERLLKDYQNIYQKVLCKNH